MRAWISSKVFKGLCGSVRKCATLVIGTYKDRHDAALLELLRLSGSRRSGEVVPIREKENHLQL